MSTSISNIGIEDVLLMIFDLLDGEDLVNCEAVCRQWRAILLTASPWRRLFNRQVNPFSPLSRRVLKQLEFNEYRDVCRSILKVKRNWRTRIYKQWFHEGDERKAFDLSFRDDHVAWNFCCQEEYEAERPTERTGWAFLDSESDSDSESMKITETRPNYMFDFEFFDKVRGMPKTKMAVSIQCPRHQFSLCITGGKGGYISPPVLFTGRSLVCLSGLEVGDHSLNRIRVWRLTDFNNLMLTVDRSLDYNSSLKMLYADDKFIIATKRVGVVTVKTLLFISTETLRDVRAVSLIDPELCIYNRGLLFNIFKGNGIVRILDVASGTYFNDLHLPFGKESAPSINFLRPFVKSNSHVIVIGWQCENEKNETGGILSRLSVYDLDAVKNVKQQQQPGLGCRPLYPFEFPFNISEFELDDSRLAVIGTGYDNRLCVTVLNFSTI
jgi:hypothetical protein